MLKISILLKMHSSGSENDNEGTGNAHNEMSLFLNKYQQIQAPPQVP